MSDGVKRISYREFHDNLAALFSQVVHEHEAIVVENEHGEAVIVRPAEESQRRPISEADYEAFLASAGGWKDVDVDQFLKDNAESRRMSTRPAVEL
jgi:PHD/YefM family antitoxin component YafN of YafNO toxin-antitoxin module